jgi:hypothetical protein
VIVHIASTTPDDVAECAVRLVVVESVGGVELGVRDEEDEGAIAALIAAAVEASERPVLVRLPLERRQSRADVRPSGRERPGSPRRHATLPWETALCRVDSRARHRACAARAARDA